MSLQIDVTDVADMEMQDGLLWQISRSPANAGRWQEGLERAIESLVDFPRRCPVAPESAAFSVEVRQLLYGKYRIMYAILDTDDDGEDDIIRILHVRHTSRGPLMPDESEST